ncbi:hypothetical protein H681_09325 [Pseudomonas sp. ATCC 13867]|nr:hypothetical protein H681_09325 [Pseudomonas sp. ATCC 13867]
MHRLGLEAQLLGRKKKFGTTETLVILGKLMSELLRGGCHIMKARQHDQGRETCIDHWRGVSPRRALISHRFIPETH